MEEILHYYYKNGLKLPKEMKTGSDILLILSVYSVRYTLQMETLKKERCKWCWSSAFSTYILGRWHLVRKVETENFWGIQYYLVTSAGGRHMQGNGIFLHSLGMYVKHSIITISNNLPMPNALHSCTLYLQYYERIYIWRVKWSQIVVYLVRQYLMWLCFLVLKFPSPCTVTVFWIIRRVWLQSHVVTDTF